MAETLLRERCTDPDNPEATKAALEELDRILYPDPAAAFVPLAPDEDPFAGTDAEGMAPPWA